MAVDESKKSAMEEMIDDGYESEEDDAIDIEEFLKEGEDSGKEESKKEEGKKEDTPKEERKEPTKVERYKEPKIPESAVKMYSTIQEKLDKIAPDKQKEVSELAGALALGMSEEFEKQKEEIRQLRMETFKTTEAGQFYEKAREMFPDLTPDQAITGYEKYKGMQLKLESSSANRRESKPQLDKDGKTIARLWGLKEDDMLKEQKRYEKIMKSGDPRIMRKAGEIEI